MSNPVPASLNIAQRVLAISAWLIILGLVFFLWRIAYFYEHASGERLYHYLIVIPALLLAAGAAWYIVRACDFVGEPVGDSLLFLGALTLVLFGCHLQELMTGERK